MTLLCAAIIIILCCTHRIFKLIRVLDLHDLRIWERNLANYSAPKSPHVDAQVRARLTSETLELCAYGAFPTAQQRSLCV